MDHQRSSASSEDGDSVGHGSGAEQDEHEDSASGEDVREGDSDQHSSDNDGEEGEQHGNEVVERGDDRSEEDEDDGEGMAKLVLPSKKPAARSRKQAKHVEGKMDAQRAATSVKSKIDDETLDKVPPKKARAAPKRGANKDNLKLAEAAGPEKSNEKPKKKPAVVKKRNQPAEEILPEAVEPKKRGRPKKQVESGESEKPTKSNQLEKVEVLPTAVEPKKRGRPKKQVALGESDQPLKEVAAKEGPKKRRTKKEMEEAAQMEDAVPKRRQRKNDDGKAEQEEATAKASRKGQKDVETAENVTEAAVPKKRGVPQKVVNENDGAPAPKKRGRPKKVQEDVTQSAKEKSVKTGKPKIAIEHCNS